MKTKKIKEQKYVSTGLVVDRANGVIRNAKICGFKSKNNRVYTENALREGVHLYDGAVVNIDHLTENESHRKLTDRLGRIVNPRFVEGEGIRGDFEILVSHPMAEMIFEAAEKGMPLGFSHTAEGEVEDKNNVEYVVRLESITSVDVVANPATNTTFAESVIKKGKSPMEISEEQKALLEAADNKKKAVMADDMIEDEDDMEESEDSDMEESEECNEEDEVKEEDADVSGVDDQKSVGKVKPKLGGAEGTMPKDYVKESTVKVKSQDLVNLIEGSGINVNNSVKQVLGKLSKVDAVTIIRSIAEAGMVKTAGVNLKESVDGKQLPKNIFAWLKD